MVDVEGEALAAATAAAAYDVEVPYMQAEGVHLRELASVAAAVVEAEADDDFEVVMGVHDAAVGVVAEVVVAGEDVHVVSVEGEVGALVAPMGLAEEEQTEADRVMGTDLMDDVVDASREAVEEAREFACNKDSWDGL